MATETEIIAYVVAGGLAESVIDPLAGYAVVSAVGYEGNEPFAGTPLATMHYQELILLAGSGLATLIGNRIKNDALFWGGLGFFLAEATKEITEIIWEQLKPVAGLGRAWVPGAEVGVTAPTFIPGVLMPKYQYGDGNVRPGLSAVVGARPQTRAVPVRVEVGPYAGGITAPKFIPGPLRPYYTHGR